MEKETIDFADLSSLFGRCGALEDVFRRHGVAFSPPVLSAGEASVRTNVRYICSKATIEHQDSSAASVSIGLMITDGKLYEHVVIIRDGQWLVDNMVFFTETDNGWLLTIHATPHAPVWFAELSETLKRHFWSEPNLRVGAATYQLVAGDTAIAAAAQALAARKK